MFAQNNGFTENPHPPTNYLLTFLICPKMSKALVKTKQSKPVNKKRVVCWALDFGQNE